MCLPYLTKMFRLTNFCPSLGTGARWNILELNYTCKTEMDFKYRLLDRS